MDCLQVSYFSVMVNLGAGIPWEVSGVATFTIQVVN